MRPSPDSTFSAEREAVVSARALISPAAPLSVRGRDVVVEAVAVVEGVCVSVGGDTTLCSAETSVWRFHRSGSARPSLVLTRMLVGRLVGVRTSIDG